MKDLMNSNVLTMTSREIASLAEKDHRHVLRDIRTMMDALQIDESSFGQTYLDSQNREQLEYRLPKRETLVLVSGYSLLFRTKIIDRWQELESQPIQPQFNIPTTLSGALRLAAEQAETIEAQALLIEHQRPAVEFLDRYVESKSTKGIREVAKVLGAKEREFVKYLEDSKIMFRQGNSLMPYAHYQHSGYFEVKTGEQNGHSFTQARFTPDGIAFIAKLWSGKI